MQNVLIISICSQSFFNILYQANKRKFNILSRIYKFCIFNRSNSRSKPDEFSLRCVRLYIHGRTRANNDFIICHVELSMPYITQFTLHRQTDKSSMLVLSSVAQL